MKFIRENLWRIFLIAFLVVSPVFSFAQWPDATGDVDLCNPEKEICNPITANDLPEFVQTILVGVIKIGIPIIALAIVYSGFLFVAARGNAEKITKAKKALLYTLIGAAILLGSWAIAKLISETVLGLG